MTKYPHLETALGRRAAIIEKSYKAYESARESFDPKRYKRGGSYHPEEIQTIAKSAGLRKSPSNRARGELEFRRFLAERPEKITAYYKDNARVGAPISFWTGKVIGHITHRGAESRAMGTKVVSIRMKAITGDTYSGRCNLETGDYCNLKKVKGK